jgi:hypothetical protein
MNSVMTSSSYFQLTDDTPYFKVYVSPSFKEFYNDNGEPLVGFLIYFSYGSRNSSEKLKFKRKQASRVHVNTSNNQYKHFPNQNQFS